MIAVETAPTRRTADWVGALEVRPTARVYQPEDHPFEKVFVEITHRCNMGCANCYIPNRSVPDMDVAWLRDILERMPGRVQIRLSGGEPTMRDDLPDIVAMVRETGHFPLVMSNGLRLCHPGYVRELKSAGLRAVYLSLNGGLEDEYYRIIDGMPCAAKKLAALDTLLAERIYVTVGMILVRGVNESELAKVYERVKDEPRVPEIHLRGIGKLGRYSRETEPYTLEELVEIARPILDRGERTYDHDCGAGRHAQWRVGRRTIQLAQWPMLDSDERGRICPDGTLQPTFEHVMANEGGY